MKSLLTTTFIVFSFALWGQNSSDKELSLTEKTDSTTSSANIDTKNGFSLRGYGAVNYYDYRRYDTDVSLKDKFDPERLNLYLEYRFDEKLSFKSEIEFEHGGTGSTLELDNQEESGEIEREIEKGGEVKLEQININYKFSEAFNIRAGRIKIYLNAAQNIDSPTDYFTTHRQEMENTILPLGWYENGLEFHGIINRKWRYYLTITNGLESSGFSSGNWVKLGYQQKFEMQNTEAFAYSGRMDYLFGNSPKTFAGIGVYLGDTNPNRPKKDLTVPSYLSILTAHINYNENHLRFSMSGIYGNLQNSDKIALANSKVSNALGAKRTPVAKNAIGFSADIGYEILHFWIPEAKQKLYPFVRYDFYDTMYKTAGLVVDNKRWQRSSITAGLNFFVHKQIVLKAQYTSRTLGSEHIDYQTIPITPTGRNQMENYFSAGIGFFLKNQHLF